MKCLSPCVHCGAISREESETQSGHKRARHVHMPHSVQTEAVRHAEEGTRSEGHRWFSWLQIEPRALRRSTGCK